MAMPGSPRRTIDVAFTGAKVAVFVNGCFWHACAEHATWPARNAAWWRAKLEANVARDEQTDARLRALGWEVVRVWEHEESSAAADRVEAVLGRRASQA